MLIAATSWAYATSFEGAFVLDDIPSIAENQSIRHLRTSLWATGEVTTSGRPIANLSFATNYALAPDEVRDVMAPSGPATSANARERFRRNLWGYHVVNLAIHALSALVLFGVVRRTLLAGRLRARFETAAAPVAFTAALLWAVHPLTTEAVTYIVQRVESLMGLFYLLTLYCAIRASDGNGMARYWTAGAIAACALGMGTKENMVSAPIAVALWDVLFGNPVETKRRRGLYAGLALTWLVLALLVALEPREQSVGLALGWTWHSYLLTQAGIIVHYLSLVFWPSPLVFDYGWPPAGSLADAWVPLVAVGALAMLTAGLVVKRHPIGFPLACFFLILAPTSSVLPITTQVAAEHRMYLPLACVIAIVAALAFLAGRHVAAGGGLREATQKLIAAAVVTALGLPLGLTTRHRNLDYRSEETLYLDTIGKRPENPRPYVGYGAVLLGEGRFAEAEPYLRQAIALAPTDARAHMNLGGSLCALGRCGEGLRHLEEAARLKPDLPQVHGMLGEAYAGSGDEPRALASLERAASLMPSNPFVLNRLGMVLVFATSDDVRNPARGAEFAQQAIRLDSTQVMFYHTLAMGHALSGNTPEALKAANAGVQAAEAIGQSRAALEMRDLERRLRQGR